MSNSSGVSTLFLRPRIDSLIFLSKKTFKLIDPRNYNGAMFIGLNGISIKSHGNSDEVGIASAIKTACQLHSNNINEKIKLLLKSHV